MPEVEKFQVSSTAYTGGRTKAPFPLLECRTCWGHGFVYGPLSEARCPNPRCKAGKTWLSLQSEFTWPLDLQYDIVRIQKYKQWKADLFASMKAQADAQRAERVVEGETS